MNNLWLKLLKLKFMDDDLTLISLNGEYKDEIIGTIKKYDCMVGDYKGAFWECEKCDCLVFYNEKEISIERLNSFSKGHGKILLRYVLKNLKLEPHYNIVLFDMSYVNISNDVVLSLKNITLLKYGNFSWYEQFGFKPFSYGEEKQNIEKYYKNKSKDIKSIKTIEAINIMESYLLKYPWLVHLINHLKLSTIDQPMIDAIRSPPFDFSLLNGHELDHGLEEVFGFKYCTDWWHIQNSGVIN